MEDAMIDEYGRPSPPQNAGETATLLGFLDYQRATLEWKCRGLGGDGLSRSIAPSSMTLGGMLKHLANVEDYWFTTVVGEKSAVEPWASADFESEPDWEWQSAALDSPDSLRSQWNESVARSREVVSAALGGGQDQPLSTMHPLIIWRGDSAGSEEAEDQALSAMHPAWDGQGQVSLRWVLVHMIEEYARHNGHADLIRESIDGETGE